MTKPDIRLVKAVQEEIQKEPVNFHNARFLHDLKVSYKYGDWNSNSMDVIKRRLGLNKV